MDNSAQVTPDLDRERRIGFPEVIYCPGKTDEQLRTAGAALLGAHANVIASRATASQAEVLRSLCGEVAYDATARLAYAWRDRTLTGRGMVAVVCAGSTDVAVAEEAALTAAIMGNRVERFYDIGVAGIHRVLAVRDRLASAAVLIAVAGMEGALPSVVAGLVPCPVIAVPTSVGYGTAFGGVTALLAMLNSCAPGVTVVNIDNGFGAAFAASRINRR